MNEYQINMYNALMKLVERSEAFYIVDHELDGSLYRVFTYRLASYTDFCQEHALDARGVMFEIDMNTKEPIRLASLPPQKFFNDGENPFTMNLHYSNIKTIMDKRDGSLISTFVHSNKIRLKSKTSISSEQALAAQAYLDSHPDLKDHVRSFVEIDYTVNFEYTAPKNRIVLSYEKEELRILNVRCNLDGRIYTADDIAFSADAEKQYRNLWVDHYKVDDNMISTLKEDRKGIEGYIVVFGDGTWAKIKTDWYLSLHRLKDSVNSDYNLFLAIINEAVDDLKASFKDDVLIVDRITKMENAVIPRFNHLISSVERFYEENDSLDRKSYAIKGKAEANEIFGLVMSKYLGKEVDYKGYADKNYKRFIIGAELNVSGE